MNDTNIDSAILSAIIIDDEPDAINLLEMYLRKFPFVQVTGKEDDAARGLELVIETSPDLVFLDIDMPGMNGLQVAGKIQTENFHSEIVFTTAHAHYAYDALGIKPLDFLTKPFCSADLEKVMQKYKAKTERKLRESKLEKFIYSHSESPKIKVPSTQGILIVDIKDIVALKSQGNNCQVFLQDGTSEIITRNLYVVIDLINSQSFIRINRSVYINVNFLERVDKKTAKCIMRYNNTKSDFSFSRAYLTSFEKLNLFPTL